RIAAACVGLGVLCPPCSSLSTRGLSFTGNVGIPVIGTMVVGVGKGRPREEKSEGDAVRNDWHGGVMDLRTGRERPYTGPIRLRPLDRYGWPVVTLKGRPITNAIRFLLHTRRIGRWVPPVPFEEVI